MDHQPLCRLRFRNRLAIISMLADEINVMSGSQPTVSEVGRRHKVRSDIPKQPALEGACSRITYSHILPVSETGSSQATGRATVYNGSDHQTTASTSNSQFAEDVANEVRRFPKCGRQSCSSNLSPRRLKPVTMHYLYTRVTKSILTPPLKSPDGVTRPWRQAPLGSKSIALFRQPPM